MIAPAQSTNVLRLIALLILVMIPLGCTSEEADTSVYLSQRNSGSVTSTSQLEAGTYAIRLASASDYPTGPFRSGDPSRSCRYQVEVIQTTDAQGNTIYDGFRTSGYRFIARFRWIREASGGLDRPDLNGSETLFSGDGPILVQLPERAKYMVRAGASGSGRTEIETCRFSISMRRTG